MSREEAISHLGTIARSGTAEFFKKLSGDQQKDSQLIGQFGVGFYSAFIVAERVEVLTRRAGLPASEGVRWESAADGDFTVETVERAERGTTIVLHLKDDAKEFLDAWRLRSLVRRYSDHIAFPVRMPKEGEATVEYEAVNRGTALWARPKGEIKDEEYVEFYRHLTHDPGEPLTWSHNRVEGKRDYTSLVYIPARGAVRPVAARWRARAQAVRAPRVHHGRRGAVPAAVPALRQRRARFGRPAAERVARAAAVGQRSGGHARGADQARARPAGEARQGRGREVPGLLERVRRGAQGRPGRRSRQSRQAAAAAALRFHAQATGDAEEVSLADYVARMQTGQDKIYYVVGESFAAARSHPAIEGLRARNVEVLLLGRRIDAWVMDHLQDFEGKQFKDATRGDLELGALASAADKEKAEAQLKESEPLLKRVKDALGERVSEVRVSTRLKDSAAVLVAGEHDISAPLRRALEAAGQKAPAGKPVLELNVDHHLVKYLGASRRRRGLRRAGAGDLRAGDARRRCAASRSGRVRAAAQSHVDAACSRDCLQ